MIREAFVEALTELASQDRRVVFLMADNGNTLFDNYKKYFPMRFYNCGIAEQNMVGIAAGMALGGLRPFTYTIAAFATARCYEQIKLDVGYQNLPVTIVGAGAGDSYEAEGFTHVSHDDIPLMTLVPNMKIYTPLDPEEVKKAVFETGEGPAYLRLVYERKK